MSVRGVRLGSILGVPVRLDWSVVAIFGLISWSLSASVYPGLVGGYQTAEYWIAGITTAALFFTSLLAHELSHSVVAQRLGIGVRDITLWLFGGVSTIEGEAHTPRDEMKIAIAGPATSAAIAVGALVLALLFAAGGAPRLLTGCMLWLGSINVVLAIFNLAPAAPLDGGRVLHAWLWHRRGDRDSAGQTATRAGRGFGWILVTLGFVEFATTDAVGGIWFVLLGSFLISAARGEEAQLRIARDLDTVRVRDVMTASPITVPEDAPVDQLLDDYTLGHHCSALPVVAHDGRVLGLVTIGRIRRLAPAERRTTRAADLATRLADVTIAAPDDLLMDVLRRARTGSEGRVLVLSDDELVGIVSATDVARAIQVSELARAA